MGALRKGIDFILTNEDGYGQSGLQPVRFEAPDSLAGKYGFQKISDRPEGPVLLGLIDPNGVAREPLDGGPNKTWRLCDLTPEHQQILDAFLFNEQVDGGATVYSVSRA